MDQKKQGQHAADDAGANPAAAVTITPTENILTLNPGDSFSETIVVTIPPFPFGNQGFEVKLVPIGNTAPFVVSITPASSGPLSPQQQHVLTFNVVFNGVVPCRDVEQVFDGRLDVVATIKVDTAPAPVTEVIARKKVHITVPPCPDESAVYTYSVKFICGEQRDCSCECTSVRPGIYATEINIHNYHEKEVRVVKHITPLILAGASIGREPKFGLPKAKDHIILPPHGATMDDCCRLGELLFGGKPSSPMPLMIGFLEITSTEDLAVTAVYTVSSASGSISIDVEQINAARVRRRSAGDPD
jgi:hypothetical protein